MISADNGHIPSLHHQRPYNSCLFLCGPEVLVGLDNLLNKIWAGILLLDIYGPVGLLADIDILDNNRNS